MLTESKITWEELEALAARLATHPDTHTDPLPPETRDRLGDEIVRCEVLQGGALYRQLLCLRLFVLVTVLGQRLDACVAASVSDELADVIEWIGASDHERGRALRDVLRLYDTIARSRDPVRRSDRARFPRFAVRPDRRAS